MNIPKNLIIILSIVACLAWTTQASAAKPTAEQIANKCMTAMNAVADQCVESNEAVADKCVKRIENLLEAGEFESAFDLAGKRINTLRQKHDRCIKRISNRCETCVKKLQRVENPELVEKVKTAYAAQKSRIIESTQQTVDAIKAALPTAP